MSRFTRSNRAAARDMAAPAARRPGAVPEALRPPARTALDRLPFWSVQD